MANRGMRLHSRTTPNMKIMGMTDSSASK
jgi:hypothetical protein